MGGKSFASLAVVGADDCMRHAGLKVLLLRKVGVSGRESFEALLPKTIGRLGTYIPSQSKFAFPNGSWIRLGHFQNESDVDKYLGLEYDVIATEEATTLSQCEESDHRLVLSLPGRLRLAGATVLQHQPGRRGSCLVQGQVRRPASQPR